MAVQHEAILNRKDMFHVDPRQIKIIDGWNPRRDFGNMDELKSSIIANGVLEPITVRIVDDEMQLTNGERRLKAALMAIEEGHEIKSIPAIISRRNISDSEAFFEAIIKNDGKPLSPNEEALAYHKLQSWGFSAMEIGNRVGRSNVHVLNRLKLIDASPELRKAIDEKKIGVTRASQIVKESKGNIEAQKEKLRVEKDAPKQKSMSKTDIKVTLEYYKSGGNKDKLTQGVMCGLYMVLNNVKDMFDAMEDMKRDGF